MGHLNSLFASHKSRHHEQRLALVATGAGGLLTPVASQFKPGDAMNYTVWNLHVRRASGAPKCPRCRRAAMEEAPFQANTKGRCERNDD